MGGRKTPGRPAQRRRWPKMATTSASTGRCPGRTAGQPKLGRGHGSARRTAATNHIPLLAPAPLHCTCTFARWILASGGGWYREKKGDEERRNHRQTKQSNTSTQTLDIEGHPGAAFSSFYYRQQGKHEYEHSYHSPICDSMCICTFLLLYQITGKSKTTKNTYR